MSKPRKPRVYHNHTSGPFCIACHLLDLFREPEPPAPPDESAPHLFPRCEPGSPEMCPVCAAIWREVSEVAA